MAKLFDTNTELGIQIPLIIFNNLRSFLYIENTQKIIIENVKIKWVIIVLIINRL